MKLFLLNIRKGQAESVNHARTESTMTKNKKDKWKTNTHKTKTEQQDLY